MRNLVYESTLLVGFSLLLALLLGSVRGMPSIEEKPSAAATSCAAPDGSDYKNQPQWLGVEAARLLFESHHVRFLDAREPDAYVQGHITGALSTPTSQMVRTNPPSLYTMLRSTQTVVVYCDTSNNCGQSSRLAHHLIRSVPDLQVRILEGGMPEWLAQNLPAESGSCGNCSWL